MNGKTQGFTLLEVLVALGIVSVISILSWQGLQEVLRSANRVSQVDEQVQTTSAVFGQLEKDLAALELNPNAQAAGGDAVEITSRGLRIRSTQRKSSEPAYREEVEWILEAGQLVRMSRNELNPEKPSTGIPVPTTGLQVRMLMEPGGWTPPVAFGEFMAQERNDLELQGPVTQPANNVPPPPSGPDGVDNQAPDPAPQQNVQSRPRAVEVSLTQPNRQTVTRVLLTGGVY